MTDRYHDPEFARLFDAQPNPHNAVRGHGLALASMIATLIFSGRADCAIALGWGSEVVDAWIGFAVDESTALWRRSLRTAAEAQRLRDVADWGALRFAEAHGLPVCDRQSESQRRGVRAHARAAGIPRMLGNLQTGEAVCA